VIIVGIETAAVDKDLLGGRLSCPCCGSALRPFGHGVEREVAPVQAKRTAAFQALDL
jgi:hypothetical protein